MNFRNQVLLAPLTKGGTLPFRRLCRDFGAQITCSEMIYAHQLVKKKNRREQALLRHHPDETQFGVQLAAYKPEVAVEAAHQAVEAGARFIDLNCGCPIHDTVRRGMGARLLEKTRRLGQILSALTEALDIPVTVKLRTGVRHDRINLEDTVQVAADAGVQAITVHGRTKEQRYTRSADWELVGKVAHQVAVPVIGNGDILTHYEAKERRIRSGLSSVMVARGALIKPWIFRELAEEKDWLPTPEERVEVYFRLAGYYKDYLGHDAIGIKRSHYFLSWHFKFFCRYRPFPEQEFARQAQDYPLLQTRDERTYAEKTLERLLTQEDEAVHAQVATALLDSSSLPEASSRLVQLAECSSTAASAS